MARDKRHPKFCEEVAEELEGGEVRAKGLLNAISGIDAMLLREVMRR